MMKDKIQLYANSTKLEACRQAEEMEKLNGLSTFLKLKQINSFNIPVIIMITKKEIDLNNINYLDKGINDYLVLPGSRDEINTIINKFIDFDD